MRLYRSIGQSELETLFFQKQPVVGKYHCNVELRNSSNLQNAICFFLDEIRWEDRNHEFFIVLDIPHTRLEFGIGRYSAAESLKKSQIWTGKYGKYEYGLREAYTDVYSLEDIKEIYIFDHFNSDYREMIKRTCEKYDIVFHVGDLVIKDGVHKINKSEFIKYGCKFVTDPYDEFDFISDELSKHRDDIVELSEEERNAAKLLNDVRTNVMNILKKGDEEALILAEKIKSLL